MKACITWCRASKVSIDGTTYFEIHVYLDTGEFCTPLLRLLGPILRSSEAILDMLGHFVDHVIHLGISLGPVLHDLGELLEPH